MNLLQRALLNIKRQPVQASVLFCLILILSTVMVGAVVIRNAVDVTQTNLRQSMPPVIMIEESGLMQAETNVGHPRWSEIGTLTPEILYDMATHPVVTYFDYAMTVAMYSQDLMPFEIELAQGSTDFGIFTMSSVSFETDQGFEFVLNGVSHPDFIDQRLGFVEVTQGHTFTESQLVNGEQVVIVPLLWARKNGLSIGSNIQLSSVEWNLENEVIFYETYYFEIIGFFETAVDEFNPNMNEWTPVDWREVLRYQEFYVPNTVARRIRNERRHRFIEYFYPGNPVDINYFNILRPKLFVLADHDDVERFIEDVSPLLPGFYVPFAYADRFADVNASMDTLMGVANVTLLASFVAIVSVVSLVMALLIGDRQREFGIYLALGYARGKLICQLILEIGLVSLIAIGLSIFIGSGISIQMSHLMLNQQLSHIHFDDRETGMFAEAIDPFEVFGFGTPPTGAEMIEMFDTSLTVQEILIYFLAGTAIMTVTTTMPLLKIVFMSPKKILL